MLEKRTKPDERTEKESILKNSLRIVPLQEGHIASLAAMEREVFSQPWSERSFRDLLTRDYCHYLVAELVEDPLPTGMDRREEGDKGPLEGTTEKADRVGRNGGQTASEQSFSEDEREFRSGRSKRRSRPVGIAGMVILAGEGDIDKVMVAPDMRRCGIADLLLEALLQRGREQGVTAFTLEVRRSNEAAIMLYKKHGFQQEGVRPGFYEKPAEDALILWKRQ